jgi:hypothetical protein
MTLRHRQIVSFLSTSIARAPLSMTSENFLQEKDSAARAGYPS